MKELVIISGKGGTGKTSITASFAMLANDMVMADCDVDAADLHLLLRPDIQEEGEFVGGKVAEIKQDFCMLCGQCVSVCRFDAITDGYSFEVNPMLCEGCSVCSFFCPYNAISMNSKVSGNWFISDTRYGPMVHAKLGIAAENSGKMVSLVREKAKLIAEQNGFKLVIVDGAPGIGCPVIASITGASHVLVVTEPTVSGIHDLKRVIELSEHFRIPLSICINKFDIHEENTEEITVFANKKGLDIAGKIPYDTDFVISQVEAKSIVEYSDGAASREIRNMWHRISESI